jgi:hypothetical protein
MSSNGSNVDQVLKSGETPKAKPIFKVKINRDPILTNLVSGSLKEKRYDTIRDMAQLIVLRGPAEEASTQR